MAHVEVIAGIRFRQVAVSIAQIPLADALARVIAGVVVANSPIMDRKRARTFSQWKSPPKLTCSSWNSPERKDSVDPTMVWSLGWLKSCM